MRALQTAFRHLLLTTSLRSNSSLLRTPVSALAMPRTRPASGAQAQLVRAAPTVAVDLLAPRERSRRIVRRTAPTAVLVKEEVVLAEDTTVRDLSVTVKDEGTAGSKHAKPGRRKRAKQEAAAKQLPGPAAEPGGITEEAAAAPQKKRRRGTKAAAASAVPQPKAAVADQEAKEEAAAPEGKLRKPRAKRKAKEPELTEEEAAELLRMVPLPTAFPPGKLIGAHVSMASGIERAVINAASIGAKAFALDTRSKRRWDCPPLADTNAAAFRRACVAFGFSPRQILPHGSYLINLGSPVPETQEKSYPAFVQELQRCQALGIALYNIHPGSTNKLCTPEECMERIADSINRAHAETAGVTVVLENVAGMGGSVGHTFEQLAYIIEHVSDKSRVGVCLDTCHMFAAGYDVSTPAGYAQVMDTFGSVVGFDMLKGMHVNDSKCGLGSKRDRHENIGRGLIGMTCFECLMNDPRLDGIPLIMETPVQEKGPAVDYKKSLAAGEVVLRQGKNDDLNAPECTDTRDIRLLYSLCT